MNRWVAAILLALSAALFAVGGIITWGAWWRPGGAWTEPW